MECVSETVEQVRDEYLDKQINKKEILRSGRKKKQN